jgi:hypothetical protein
VTLTILADKLSLTIAEEGGHVGLLAVTFPQVPDDIHLVLRRFLRDGIGGRTGNWLRSAEHALLRQTGQIRAGEPCFIQSIQRILQGPVALVPDERNWHDSYFLGLAPEGLGGHGRSGSGWAFQGEVVDDQVGLDTRRGADRDDHVADPASFRCAPAVFTPLLERVVGFGQRDLLPLLRGLNAGAVIDETVRCESDLQADGHVRLDAKRDRFDLRNQRHGIRKTVVPVRFAMRDRIRELELHVRGRRMGMSDVRFDRLNEHLTRHLTPGANQRLAARRVVEGFAEDVLGPGLLSRYRDDGHCQDQ